MSTCEKSTCRKEKEQLTCEKSTRPGGFWAIRHVKNPHVYIILPWGSYFCSLVLNLERKREDSPEKVFRGEGPRGEGLKKCGKLPQLWKS